MKKLLGSVKAKVVLGVLGALMSVGGAAYGDWCYTYSHSMRTWDAQYGEYCYGASNFNCTQCYNEGAGTACATVGSSCSPGPFHQNPNP